MKIEHFRGNVSLSRDPAKPVTVFLKFLSLSRVADTGESVGQGVLGCGDPFGDEPALGHDFAGGDCT